MPTIPDLPTSHWFWLFFCAWLFGMAKAGVKGVGTFAVPVMAAIFGGKASSGLVLPMLMAADAFAVLYYRRDADWFYIRKLLPAAVVGILLGVAVGDVVDDLTFKRIIAVVVLSSVVLMVVQMWRPLSVRVVQRRRFSYGFGLVGGFSTMIGNAAGPVMDVYLLSLRLPKMSFIGTSAWFFFVVNLVKFPLQIMVWGAITPDSLLLNAASLPAIALGLWTGIRIVQWLPERAFRGLVVGMTFLAAVRLLF